MNLESLPDKQLHELERLTSELLEALRRAKLKDDPLADALRSLEKQAGQIRRERYDAANPEYRGY